MPEALSNSSGMAHGHFVPDVVKQRSGRAEPMPATFGHETGMATSNRPDENRFWWTCRANGFIKLQ